MLATINITRRGARQFHISLQHTYRTLGRAHLARFAAPLEFSIDCAAISSSAREEEAHCNYYFRGEMTFMNPRARLSHVRHTILAHLRERHVSPRAPRQPPVLRLMRLAARTHHHRECTTIVRGRRVASPVVACHRARTRVISRNNRVQSAR